MANCANVSSTSDTTTPTLLALAPEVQGLIADSVDDVGDLLNLRLAGAGNEDLSKSILKATANRMTTIYIEHSKSSLERFREVCNSEEHALRIREIKYVATIRTASAAEVAQSRRFHDAVVHHNVADDVVNQVLATYGMEKDEQAALLERGELCATLCEVVKKLPNLVKISQCGKIELWDCERDSEGVWVVQEPPRAYNRLRRWFIPSRANPSRLSPVEQLLYIAQYEVQAKTDNLVTVIKAIASAARELPKKSIELAIEGAPLTILDQEFENLDQHTIDTALQALTSVSIAACTLPTDDLEGTIIPRWERFLSSATNVKTLAFIPRNTRDITALKAIIERVDFPELEHLRLEGWISYWSSVPVNAVGCYSAQALGSFLTRHSHTLKSLQLRCASGIEGPPTYESTISSFIALLDLMKTSLPQLQSAQVLEAHLVFYEDDSAPIWSVGTPYGHLPPAERDRAREQDSDIGRLARSCGVTVTEKPMFSVNNPSSIGGERGYGVVNRAFRYEYDFGPYVLRDRT